MPGAAATFPLVTRAAGSIEGSALADKLESPLGVAIKPGGGFYVADTQNHRILAFDEGSTEGRIVAGGKKGSALAGDLKEPSGVAIKPRGGFFVADTWNHRILEFEEGSTEGRIVAGGKEGSALAGELKQPGGVAIKPGGGIYVADTFNHRILAFEEGSSEGHIVAGGKEGSALAGELHYPNGVSIRPGGGIYVVDTRNNRVLEFDEGSIEGRIVAGALNPHGWSKPPGEGGILLPEALDSPVGIAIKPGGGFYVTDTSNNQILEFEEGSRKGRIVAGGKEGGAQAGELNKPCGVAIKPSGGFYIADTGNERILSVDDVTLEEIEAAFTSNDIDTISSVFVADSNDLIASISSLPCVYELSIELQKRVIVSYLEARSKTDVKRACDVLVAVWGFSHLEQMLENIDDTKFTEEVPRALLLSEILAQKSQKYDFLAVVKDSVLPAVDYGMDNIALVTYILLGQYGFFGIVAAGILFNVFLTSFLMWSDEDQRYGKGSLAVHVCTLGLYGFVAEARHCGRIGKKTELLLWMKKFELVESTISFMVGAYTLSISGYLHGFKPLKGLNLIIRYCSVSLSLVMLPVGAFDFSMRELSQKSFELRDKKSTLSFYVAGCQGVCAQLALFIFHATEVQCQVTLLILQLATRPYGIFIFLSAFWLLTSSVVAFGKVSRADRDICLDLEGSQRRQKERVLNCLIIFLGAFLLSPLYMIVNPVSSNLSWKLARNVSFVRLLTIAGAWATLVIVWRLGAIDGEIISHLVDAPCLPLLCISLLGSLLHPIMFLQQLLAGRFQPFQAGGSKPLSDYYYLQDGDLRGDNTPNWDAREDVQYDYSYFHPDDQGQCEGNVSRRSFESFSRNDPYDQGQYGYVDYGDEVLRRGSDNSVATIPGLHEGV